MRQFLEVKLNLCQASIIEKKQRLVFNISYSDSQILLKQH